ncbi:carbohydrate ABC transporter permease [Paenibacillus sp.]|uniref:carbohydrate ABC transporter permease n=1 Tax=Paenibacillus sp. TaxID=58172 RepID=UPI002D3FBCB4|nr:carbohydrate ABC transporter permease [Paenibacillus sp.]HZG85349.1 carbohydrate ABC transporter permease [Paenibacillus sp.]
MYTLSPSRRVFVAFNYAFLGLLGFLCIAPLIHVMAISFSSSSAATAGDVILWPVDFTLKSYEYILERPEFKNAFVVTLQRVALGTIVNMLLTIVIAYPLSKETSAFRFRTAYAWYFVVTILFSGGLIPWYMTIRATGLLDSLWALVLPGAVPVFNVILLLNFFRGLPKALEESAFMDGAGHWKTLWYIYVPLSLPALATIILFTVVGHWNSWFDGLILMNRPENYPLSSYLQTVLFKISLTGLSPQQMLDLAEVSNRTTKAAQVFVGALPILLVYPFLQRFFIKGIVLGSVKE